MAYLFIFLTSFMATAAYMWHKLNRPRIKEVKYGVKKNIYGKIISYDARYYICIRYFSEDKYLSFWKYDESTTHVTEWRYTGKATAFDTKKEAEETLRDIRKNPDKYIMV